MLPNPRRSGADTCDPSRSVQLMVRVRRRSPAHIVRAPIPDGGRHGQGGRRRRDLYFPVFDVPVRRQPCKLTLVRALLAIFRGCHIFVPAEHSIEVALI
jgi:hypothetical protein